MSGDAASILKDLRLFSLYISFSSFAMLILLFFKRFTRYSRIFVCLALFSFVVMMGLLFHLPVVDRLNTAKNIALMINEQKAKADYIINYSGYDQTIPFYIKQGVIVASYTGELEMGSKYEDAKNIFISEEEFFKLLSSDKKVLFITKQKRISKLQEMFPERIHMQGCQNDRCLGANY